jgi:acyl carrier protein
VPMSAGRDRARKVLAPEVACLCPLYQCCSRIPSARGFCRIDPNGATVGKRVWLHRGTDVDMMRILRKAGFRLGLVAAEGRTKRIRERPQWCVPGSRDQVRNGGVEGIAWGREADFWMRGNSEQGCGKSACWLRMPFRTPLGSLHFGRRVWCSGDGSSRSLPGLIWGKFRFHSLRRRRGLKIHNGCHPEGSNVIDKQSIENRVIDLISEHFNTPRENIKRSTTFQGGGQAGADDIGADSLDVVEFIMEVEEEFDIQVPDTDAEKIRTVGDVIDYIVAKLEERKTQEQQT